MGGLDPPIQGRHARIVPSGFVYILASQRNGTLYIGVTGNLLDRMEQHQKNEGSQFARKYGAHRKAQSTVEGLAGNMECVTPDGRVKPAHGEIWE